MNKAAKVVFALLLGYAAAGMVLTGWFAVVAITQVVQQIGTTISK